MPQYTYSQNLASLLGESYSDIERFVDPLIGLAFARLGFTLEQAEEMGAELKPAQTPVKDRGFIFVGIVAVTHLN